MRNLLWATLLWAILVGTAMAAGPVYGPMQAQNNLLEIQLQGSTAQATARTHINAMSATPTTINVLNPGTFTGTATIVINSALLNSIDPRTEYLAEHPTAAITQATVGGVAIPGSATIGEADALYGYVNNSSTTTNGVGLGVISRAVAAGTHNWGENIVVDDGGFASPTIIGNEYDIGCKNAASSCYGLNIIGVFTTGQPVNAQAITFSTLSNYRWHYDMVSWDGTADNFALIGSVTTTANSDSQSTIYDARDSTNAVHQITVTAVHAASTASLEIGLPAGGAVNSRNGGFGVIGAGAAYAYASQDGSAGNYGLAGTVGVTANSDSQPMIFNTRDSTNTVRQCTIQAVHGSATASLDVNCPAGGAVAVGGNVTATGSGAFAGLSNTSGETQAVKAVSSAYTTTLTDRVLCVSPSAALTLTLVASPPTGLIQSVVDCNGNAGTDPITVQASSGQIMGYDNVVLAKAHMALEFQYTTGGWVLR